MKRIELTKGQVALVDDEDFDELSKYEWFADWCESSQCYYAVRNSRGDGPSKMSMHRQVMQAQPGEIIDHRNHDGLDCQKANLRRSTKSQNSWNRRGLSPLNTSGVNGVWFDKRRQKWTAEIKVNGKKHFLGRFSDKIEAVRVRDEAARKYHGEFAFLNCEYAIAG